MRRIFRWLFVIAFAACAGSMALLWNYYRTGQEGSQEYGSLQETWTVKKQTAENPNEESVQADWLIDPPVLFVDFDGLREINGDIVAWIDFPGQGISYPVVQGDDNSRYLKYTFEGQRNSAGCVFEDYRNGKPMTDGNTIFYGHNMKNGSMFGFLKRYLEQEHYEQYPYFDVYTPDGTYRCFIRACCRIPAKEASYPTDFSDSGEKEKFVQGMKEQGEYEIADETVPDAPLVMLSTCVGGGNYQDRFAVLAQARRIPEQNFRFYGRTREYNPPNVEKRP